MKKVVLTIFLLFIVGCTSSVAEKPFFASQPGCEEVGGEWVETPFENYRCAIDNQPDCERLSGVWEPQGLLGQHACVFTFPDAGKQCTISEECLGGCVIIDGPQGECKETNSIFGCWTFVDGPALCVD